jgi:putative DNA primase/helicase
VANAAPHDSCLTLPTVPALDGNSALVEGISSTVVFHSLRNGDWGADLLRQVVGSRLLYDKASSHFYRWAGHWWEEVDEQFVAELSSALGPAGSSAKMVKTARSALAQQVSWDQRPDLLAVPNGVVDLKSGTLIAGKPEDYLRTVCCTEYNSQAPCHRWEQFITEVFFDSDPEPYQSHRPGPSMVGYMHRLLGYAITGYAHERILPVLWGPRGNNGKDTLFDTLGLVLGEALAIPVGKALLMGGEGNTQPFLIKLKGKRLAWLTETDADAKLNANQAKYVVGNNRLTGHAKYGHPEAFDPTHTLFLLTNYKPWIPLQDQALFRRLRLIVLPTSFVPNPAPDIVLTEGKHDWALLPSLYDVTLFDDPGWLPDYKWFPHERSMDPTLKEQLKLEAPGILAWLVRGAVEYFECGLDEPRTVDVATQGWTESGGPVGRFLKVAWNGKKTEATDLYRLYASWARSTGEALVNQTQFGLDANLLIRRQHKNNANWYSRD